MSAIEDLLYFQIKAVNLPIPVREYRFHPKRKWRSDFAWPALHVLCEVEGGTYISGRHVRPKGFENDCEKYNTAAIWNYRVIRVTTKQVKSGIALKWLEEIL